MSISGMGEGGSAMEKIARIGEEGLDLVVCPEFSVMPLILLLGAIINQWRRNYRDRGVHRTPQVQDLYPLYHPSQRCGLCQNFKQTTLTTRLYKVRTNLYPPHLRKRCDAPGCDIAQSVLKAPLLETERTSVRRPTTARWSGVEP